MSSLSRNNSIPDATFDLWQRLSNYPASETDAALKYLQEWIAKEIDADNVIWIGGVRVLRGAAAKADPFLGWRLRARVALRPDPPPYRKQLAEYYDSEHYGKLTPTYYQRSHEAKDDNHVGMDSRATMASTGRFEFTGFAMESSSTLLCSKKRPTTSAITVMVALLIASWSGFPSRPISNPFS